MKEGWKEFRLNELIKINNGKNYSHLNEGKTPVYGSGGIMCYVDSFLHDGEAVLLPRKGTLNNILYTKGRIWTVDTMYYATVNENANPYYLYCYLNILKLDQLDSGSSLPSMTQSIYYNVKVKLPELKVQQRIASILYTYDDLIEVNNKRIELLEQSARELYKEWFVRMRFPNYQNTKFNKGIPEGWEAKKIGEIVDRKKFGKTYKEVELEKIGNVIVIDQSAHPFLGFHNNKADHLATEENPIILFGDHSCKMEIMIKPFSLAENVIPFKALDNDMSIYYLYHLVNNLVVTTEYKRHWGELTSKLVLIPNNKDISNLFHEFCTSIYSQINYLKEYNLQLTEIRNRLLPRLISGKLEVKA